MKRDRTVKFMCDAGHRMRQALKEVGVVKTSGKKGGVREAKSVKHICRTCGDRAFPVQYFVGGA
jgi:hypothetical protein